MAIDQQTTAMRILIVGGGIAGLATAIALRHPYREIIVLEKSSMSREVGALISLQPNASKIVDAWNLKPFLEKYKPMVDRAFRIMNTAGEIKMEIPLDTASYGASRMCYHRQDLHAALREAAASETLPGQPAKILTSAKAVSCDCDAGTVTLEDGSVFQGDIIIGADGIHSVIRREILKGVSDIEPSPTGLSAYRILVDTSKLSHLTVPLETFDPQRSVTTMIMGHEKRIVMSPSRGGEVLGLVGLVPDEHMGEDSSNNSWTTTGSLEKLLETYHDFPVWIQDIFKCAPTDDIALWQLRDLDPVPTWTKGRAMIIGDAAHAMLPTQGQGASQSIEDAEALQAFFQDNVMEHYQSISVKLSKQEVEKRLDMVFRARYERASLIQAYSRQQARPATGKGSNLVTLNPGEFMEYNCNYNGAIKWLHAQEAKATFGTSSQDASM